VSCLAPFLNTPEHARFFPRIAFADGRYFCSDRRFPPLCPSFIILPSTAFVYSSVRPAAAGEFTFPPFDFALAGKRSVLMYGLVDFLLPDQRELRPNLFPRTTLRSPLTKGESCQAPPTHPHNPQKPHLTLQNQPTTHPPIPPPPRSTYVLPTIRLANHPPFHLPRRRTPHGRSLHLSSIAQSFRFGSFSLIGYCRLPNLIVRMFPHRSFLPLFFPYWRSPSDNHRP